MDMGADTSFAEESGSPSPHTKPSTRVSKPWVVGSTPTALAVAVTKRESAAL
jgi:hypothetical protein